MLEYWMQNGKAALSMIGYDGSKDPNQKDFEKLLKPIFDIHGNTSKLSGILFAPILFLVTKPKPNKRRPPYYVQGAGGKANFRDGFAKFFAEKIKENGNPTLDCMYCGENKALEIPSYAYPFITQKDKYPNAYSWGDVKSLALCQKCFLIGIAANNRIIFKAQQITNHSAFISMILFFSKDEKDLSVFYKNFIDSTIVSKLFSNTNLFEKSKPNAKGYDMVWYSEEVLFVFLHYISQKISRLHSIDKQLGATIFSYNFTKGTGGGGTKIYDSFEIIDSIDPFVSAIKKFNEKNDIDAFKTFFRNLRFDEDYKKSGSFVLRRKFIRNLLIHKKIDWKIVEEFITLKMREDRIIPHMKSFIHVLLNELNMPEKKEFDTVYKLGYRLGMETSKKENPNFGKKFMYQLKKTPNPPKFLETLQLLQSIIGALISKSDMLLFSEDQKKFRIRKTMFLMGFTNALISKTIGKKILN